MDDKAVQKSQLPGNSTVNTSEEYSDLLRKKGDFVNKLSSAIENFQNNSNGKFLVYVRECGRMWARSQAYNIATKLFFSSKMYNF